MVSLTSTLEAKIREAGFRRPIEIEQSYYSKGKPNGTEDYFVRPLTLEEGKAIGLEDEWADGPFLELEASGFIQSVVEGNPKPELWPESVTQKGNALWLTFDENIWSIGVNDEYDLSNGEDEQSLVEVLDRIITRGFTVQEKWVQ